ncbi:Coiled-coil and C2 domain-containing protein 1B, partial [Kappamyces sp. JEL0680]
GALESLRSAKELEKRIAELSQLETEKETSAVQADAREHGLDAEGASSPNTPAAAPKPARTEEPKPLSVPAPTSDLMEQRSKEYKRAALRYKKEGNLEMAREMLSTAKAIEKAAVDARHGLARDDYVLPPEPSEPKPTPETAVEPAATPVSVAITAATVQTSTKETTSQLVQHLLDTLDSQIALCTKLSAQYFTANQKDLALDFHKRKKTMTQMKQTLSTMKHLPLDPQNLPFQFSYTTLEYTIAQSHPDVALDQMEVAIIKGMDMSAAGDASIETGVWFDMGWPFNASGTLPEGKGGTATLKGLHPGKPAGLTAEYQLKQTIKIERTKAFQRFLERRKATFEAYAVTKSLFGIMSTKTPLGKAVVKLDDLLSKCEIHQVVQAGWQR